MKIQEVPILPEQTKRAKISAKVISAVDDYLGEKGIARDQLNTEQLDCLIKYIKSKRAEKKLTIIYVLGAMFYVAATIVFWSLPLEMAREYVPTTKVIINSDGSETVIPPDEEHVEDYAHLCFIFAMVLVGLLYGAAISLGHILGWFLRPIVRIFLGKDKFEKFFDAFLPLVGSTSIGNTKVTLDS